MAVSESKDKKTVGYHEVEVKTVISVDDVNSQAQQLGSGVSEETINNLIKYEPFLKIENLRAGYGKMEILHDFTLKISKGESLCL
ncbi:MAG: ABC transporter ATP-binding protein, partial [SAR324 cluster bacterium]|nr:ABC transporter ATP-binding protein [SAR324 cluster bacterium]